jgi:hypothetical protein
VGWNLEVVAVKADEVDAAVPDVFMTTGTTMWFEEATSAARAPHLCAAKVGSWVIVVDVACRMSGFEEYLRDVSTGKELHLVRVTNDPIALHYRDGRQVALARGQAACLDLAPRSDRDGELCAMDLLAGRTGVRFAVDLWDVPFTLVQLG